MASTDSPPSARVSPFTASIGNLVYLWAVMEILNPTLHVNNYFLVFAIWFLGICHSLPIVPFTSVSICISPFNTSSDCDGHIYMLGRTKLL